MNNPSTMALIANYFGTPPAWFQLWLDSASFNKSITWFFFSDIQEFDFVFPENVKFIKSSFSKMKKRIEVSLGYATRYEKPWDFCRHKIAIGQIFKDELRAFDYYGWTDCDLLYGDLGLAAKYCDGHMAKVLPKGHLSFLRNDDSLTQAIVTHPSAIKGMTGEDNSGCIDEEELRFNILPEIGAKQFNDVPYANFYPRYGHFCIQDALPLANELGFKENPIPGLPIPCVFTWRDGRLMGWFAMADGRVVAVECVYIHFFKRDLDDGVGRLLPGRSYLVAPNFITEYDGHSLCWNEICKLDVPRIHWRYFINRLNWKTIKRKLMR